jgi:P-type Cu+ transporter
MAQRALPVDDKGAALPSAAALKDPVCGMGVTPKSFHSLEREGKTVYFCSANCKARFAAAPARFARANAATAPPSAAHEPAAAPDVYTCPMHPEVRQNRPGACPKCGNALRLRGTPVRAG